MELVHNERTKYLAAALDRASTACLAVGAIGQGSHVAAINLTWSVLTAVASWIAAALILHLARRIVLGGLRS